MSCFYVHIITQEMQTFSTSVVKQLERILIQLRLFLHNRSSCEWDYVIVHNSSIYIVICVYLNILRFSYDHD